MNLLTHPSNPSTCPLPLCRTGSALVLLLGLLLLTHCSPPASDSSEDSRRVDRPSPPAAAMQAADAETERASSRQQIQLTKAEAAAMQIETGRLIQRKLTRTVRCAGEVAVPPQLSAAVTAIMPGQVVNIHVREGDRVAAGRSLATLRSPAYLELQQSYLEALSRLTYLEKEVKRLKRLRNQQAIPVKQHEQVRAERDQLRARVASAGSQLVLLGIDPQALTAEALISEVSLRAPLDGWITHIGGRAGAYVSETDILFEIVSRREMHLILNVFPGDVLHIQPGQPVTFSVKGQPLDCAQAVVQRISQQADSETRSVRVHARITASCPQLKIGMPVTAEITTQASELPALPESAWVRRDTGYVVYVETGPQRYESRTAQRGAASGGYAALDNTRAFSTDTRFVVRGGHHLEAIRTRAEE